MICPKCGAPCERDEVDVGIGSVAAGPWGCPECHWFEGRVTGDPFDLAGREIGVDLASGPDVTVFRCECGATFTEAAAVLKHQRTAHKFAGSRSALP